MLNVIKSAVDGQVYSPKKPLMSDVIKSTMDHHVYTVKNN